jgi:CheY-like chemotaxis protein
MQAKIFQPFTQADASTTRRFGGTGLGLTISAELVRIMGGTLALDSQPGKGSRFHFTLPLQASAERAPSAPLAASSASYQGRILIAEDNSVNRLLLERILEREGFSYLSVANGQLAVEAAQKERFDVILMDVNMPVMDGYDATKAIRSAEAALNHRTTIVALTALAIDGDKENCLKAGMDAYLAKPLRHDDLIALLNSILIAKPATIS